MSWTTPRGMPLASDVWPLDQATWLSLLPIALGAVAVWLTLPPARRQTRLLGLVLWIVALGLLAAQAPGLATFSETAIFWLLAGITLFAAVAAVAAHSPVYSAIWFAQSLLTTGGLFIYQGAQFLGVATVVVYAGAIVVIFLFVIMLAQPEGRATFDRLSWGLLPETASVIAAALIVALLTVALSRMREERDALPATSPLVAAYDRYGEKGVLNPDHMAHLGAEIYGRHTISVEVAGALLLLAMVGAIAIVIHGKHAGAENQGDGQGENQGESQGESQRDHPRHEQQERELAR